MNSWKIVLAGIVLLYMVIASAISLTIDHLAGVPWPLLGEQNSTLTEIVIFTEPECLTAQKVLNPWELRQTTLTDGHSRDFKNRHRDFSGSDEIPSHAPMQSCEEQGAS